MLVQVPPLMQGLAVHSFLSVWHWVPEKLGVQVHVYDTQLPHVRTAQIPPFMHGELAHTSEG